MTTNKAFICISIIILVVTIQLFVVGKFIQLDIFCSNQYPEKLQKDKVINLPFGIENMKSDTSNFYVGLIGKNLDTENSIEKYPSFSFPKVKIINYIKLDSSEFYNCQNGELIDSMFTALPYQYRLPNIANYECYYSTGMSADFGDYSEEMREHCQGFTFWYYGYLTFYDRETHVANVLPIFYIQGQDGYIKSRSFYIDRLFQISLCDFAYIGDEDGKVERYVSCKYSVSISSDGIIQHHKSMGNIEKE